MCKFHRNNDSCLKKVIQHEELQNTELWDTLLKEFIIAHAWNCMCSSYIIATSVVTRPAFEISTFCKIHVLVPRNQLALYTTIWALKLHELARVVNYYYFMYYRRAPLGCQAEPHTRIGKYHKSCGKPPLSNQSSLSNNPPPPPISWGGKLSVKHGAILYSEAEVFSLSITNPNGGPMLPFDWLIHSSLILASCHRILVFCGFLRLRNKFEN